MTTPEERARLAAHASRRLPDPWGDLVLRLIAELAQARADLATIHQRLLEAEGR